MINAARRSVMMTMYEVTDRRIESALAAAAQRGVSVRVLLSGGYYGSGSDTNTAAYGFLHAHRVQVRWAPAYFALTQAHLLTLEPAKLLFVDGRVALVGSQNLSSTSPRYNRELAIRITSPAILRSLASTFAGDFASR